MNRELNTIILGINPKEDDRRINEMPTETEFHKIKEKILLGYFNCLKEKG